MAGHQSRRASHLAVSTHSRLRALILLPLILLTASCGDDAPTQAQTPVLTTVGLTPSTGTLVVQDTLRLRAIGSDQDGNEMTGLTFSWSSSDATVATVDNAGLVRGLSAGAVTISATQGRSGGTGALTVELARAPALVSGGSHACALGADNGLYCWGDGVAGQLGNAAGGSSSTPVPVSGNLAWAQVAGGQSHTCALAVNGTAHCWGANGDGQLGTGSDAASNIPVPVAGTGGFLQLKEGRGQHSCAFDTAGGLRCWGWNEYGQLGIGSTAQISVPTRAGTGRTLVTVSAGYLHSCGLTAAGNAFCWGDNRDGQLGTGDLEPSSVPVAVSGPSFKQIAAGDFHTCGIDMEDRLYCWGDNTDGQLGSGGAVQRLTPTAVAGDLTFLQVSAGFLHSCAVATGGTLHCWGGNEDGQLGDGSTSPRPEPTAVAGVARYTDVSVGDFHSCAVATDGVAHCWGWNAHGQVGDGSTTSRSSPTVVGGGVSFASAAALSTARLSWNSPMLSSGTSTLSSEARKRAMKGLDPR